MRLRLPDGRHTARREVRLPEGGHAACAMLGPRKRDAGQDGEAQAKSGARRWQVASAGESLFWAGRCKR